MSEQILDVLIVGAGISGVGAARHMKTSCPGKKVAVFEALDGFGGTWKVHTYPGIRSDIPLHDVVFHTKLCIRGPQNPPFRQVL